MVLIGSYARGDSDQYSDCDVFRIGYDDADFDSSILPNVDTTIVSFIDYDEVTFVKLYDAGS